jgi:hypothetical protein
MAKRKAAKGKKRKAAKKPARKKALKGARRISARTRETSVYDEAPPKSKTPFKIPVLTPLERQLEEGLKGSFPASDPPAVTEPAPIAAGKTKAN